MKLRDRYSRLWGFLSENGFLISLMILNLLILCLFFQIQKDTSSTLKIIENKIDIYQQYNIEIIENYDKKNFKNYKDLLKSLRITNEKINANKDKLEKYRSDTKKELEESRKNPIENIENIKQANLFIYNSSRYCSGSGTHIKIKNQHYVLTCAHLIDEKEDLISIVDNKIEYPLDLVKVDKKLDLALFKLDYLLDQPYIEISEKSPTEGSKVLVVGNPANLKDMITEGIIAKVKGGYYIITNKIYFGNSGGMLLYNGKLVGVISSVQIYYEPPCFVNYGVVTNLESINFFLSDVI